MLTYTPEPAARKDVKEFLKRRPPVEAVQVANHLEDFRGTFRFFGSDFLPESASSAQAAASHVFSFAADALLVFMEDADTHPYDMATRTGVWATEHAERHLEQLPNHFKAMLSETFSDIGKWFHDVTVTGVTTPEQAGECAAWWAVALILTWAVLPYKDGQSEDLCASVVDNLETVSTKITN